MICRVVVHQQLLEPFELEATFARPLIKLEARYSFVPENGFGHGTLQRHILLANEALSRLGSPSSQVDGLFWALGRSRDRSLPELCRILIALRRDFCRVCRVGDLAGKQRVINVFLEPVREWRDKRDKRPGGAR